MIVIPGLLLVFVVLFNPAFAVDSIVFQLDAIESKNLSSDKAELYYDSAAGLHLNIDNIRSPYLERPVNIKLQCSQARYALTTLDCENGMFSLSADGREVIKGDFSVSLNLAQFNGNLQLHAKSEQGNAELSIAAKKDRSWTLKVVTQKLSLAVFSPILANLNQMFASHEILSGFLDTTLTVQGNQSNLQSLTLNGQVKELSIEGDSVFEKVDFDIITSLNLVETETWLFENELNLIAGEAYIQPGFTFLSDQPGFYIPLDSNPNTLSIKGRWSTLDQRLEINQFRYKHPQVVEIDASANIDLIKETEFDELNMHVKVIDLSKSFPVYIQPLLMQTNFNDLELAGAIDLKLSYNHTNLSQLQINMNDVYLDDSENRFSVYGLNSELSLASEDESVISKLSWSSLSLYKLDFGAGDILFESSENEVRVMEWQDVSILDGGLKINEFSMTNLASKDFELIISGELTPISMQEFTHAMDWTIFPGQLSGKISGLRFSGNNLELDGDVNISLFGGTIRVQELDVENLLSSYSILKTNLIIDRLDLEQMTEVFSFGKIEGSLSGELNNLRLEAWQPSYFEARIATPEDDDKPHRISQKALENLNELGGGLSGTLSKGFLRFLPEYSYGRLGISCKLVNGICELGGVEESSAGFSILTKGGLFPPWVEVKGSGRSIKWDDLIDGFKQIAAGEVTIE